MSLKVRPATVHDRWDICQLHLESWQTTYKHDVSKHMLENVFPAKMKKQWAARTFCDPEVGLVAEESQLSGFVFALTDQDVPLVDNLHVRPGIQSRGIGALLLKEVLDELRTRGFQKANLEVLETNQRARDFYTRMGGQDIGACTGTLFGKTVAERRFEFDL